MLSNLADAMGLGWWEGVVNYDSSKQYRAVNAIFSGTEAIQNSFNSFLTSAKNKGRSAATALNSPIHVLELAKRWALWMPWLVLMALLLIRPIRRCLFGRIRHLWGRNNAPAAAIRFYAEALDLLKTHGLNRPKEQTPMEYAHSIENHPAGPVLLSLTKLYNATRFGKPDGPFSFRKLKCCFIPWTVL
jgi:hypothetical protein